MTRSQPGKASSATAISHNHGAEQIYIDRLAALEEITFAITSSLDLDKVLKVLLEKIALLLPYSVTHIALYREDLRRLEPVAFCNFDGEAWKRSFGKGGKGFTTRVFETMTPIVSTNLQTDPRTRDPEFARRHSLVSYLGVPLVFLGKPLGVLGFHRRTEHSFADDEVNFLTTLARHAAIAIYNSQQFQHAAAKSQALEATNRQLAALYDLASTAGESLDLDQILESVVVKIGTVFSFDTARIYLRAPEEDQLRLRVSFGYEQGAPTQDMRFSRGQGTVGWVFETGQSLILEDIRHDPAYFTRSLTKWSYMHGVNFLAAFPIKKQSEVVGAITCGNLESRRLTRDEIRLLTTMTSQVAVAVENTRLFEETRQKAEELSALNMRVFLAEETTRRRIGTGLHDDVGQTLATARIKLGQLESGLGLQSEQVREIRELVEGVNDRVRSLTFELTSPVLYLLGLRPALQDLCTRVQRETKLRVEFRSEREYYRVSDKVGAVLYRATRELLHNVVKHARTRNVTVRLGQSQTGLHVRVEDDGVGFINSKVRVTPDGGFGLYSIREQLKYLGGNAEIETAVDQGTMVSLWVPVDLGK